MIDSKFKLKDDAFMICEKFKAFDCLSFITSIINKLPSKEDIIKESNSENNQEIFYSKEYAEKIIMSLMDTGIEVAEFCMEIYPNLLEIDYFASLFKKVFMSSDEDFKLELKNKLLGLFKYNNNSISSEVEDIFLSCPKTMYSALCHAIRYNFNHFFLTKA